MVQAFTDHRMQLTEQGNSPALVRFELEGVTYLSMPSFGGHLHWYFGHAVIAVNPHGVSFKSRKLERPWGEQRVTKLADWGMLGLVRKQQPESQRNSLYHLVVFHLETDSG